MTLLMEGKEIEEWNSIFITKCNLVSYNILSVAAISGNDIAAFFEIIYRGKKAKHETLHNILKNKSN